MNARPARSVLLSVAALAGLLEFSAPADAADSRQPGELNALANSLQRCLEQDSSLVQLDSTLMRDGRVEDSLRITRGPSQCRQPVDAPSQSCPAVSAGIHRAIQVDVASVDRHPAWSPNEHARLQDGLAAIATQFDSAVDDTPDQALLLRIRSEFSGVASIQRQLDEWVKGPRSATITLELIDTQRSEQTLGRRHVAVRLPPVIRSRVSTEAHARWLRDSLNAVAIAADQLLKPARCSEPSLHATLKARDLQLDTRGYLGLRAGVTFLLVPRADAAAARAWPVARIKSVSFNEVATLEVLHGDKAVCEAGCAAIPL